LYPESKFNLVLIDVLDNELPTIKATVEQLIFPRNTVLDFNIGTALWCAARGIGYLFETKESYTSGARVLLCGIGSDEQLAGYGRHRTSFNRGGWSALDQELDMDIRRLWIRNLARDDRLISYHGKEARYYCKLFLDIIEIHFWMKNLLNFVEQVHCGI
jgi:asparagine synthetase B (glutamine-hydrolysing)